MQLINLSLNIFMVLYSSASFLLMLQKAWGAVNRERSSVPYIQFTLEITIWPACSPLSCVAFSSTLWTLWSRDEGGQWISLHPRMLEVGMDLSASSDPTQGYLELVASKETVSIISVAWSSAQASSQSKMSEGSFIASCPVTEFYRKSLTLSSLHPLFRYLHQLRSPKPVLLKIVFWLVIYSIFIFPIFPYFVILWSYIKHGFKALPHLKTYYRKDCEKQFIVCICGLCIHSKHT